jgi:hypothetical protein
MMLSYHKAISLGSLSIEITYDIVIRNCLGEIKKVIHKGYNWHKTAEFFNDLKSGGISITDYLTYDELVNKQNYTVEVIVNNELFEFH